MSLAGCVSTTLIESSPTGAALYLNEVLVGRTPYKHSDKEIIFTETKVRLELEGYQILDTAFKKDEALNPKVLLGGCITPIPYLWIMKYHPVHFYTLTPLVSQQEQKQDSIPLRTPADQLRELKQLFEENLISEEEFQKAKAKILGEEFVPLSE